MTRFAVGIDLGTTHCALAFAEADANADANGAPGLPSGGPADANGAPGPAGGRSARGTGTTRYESASSTRR